MSDTSGEFRGVVQGYQKEDFYMMGQKNSIMKVVPALFAAMTGKWELLCEMERVVEHIAIAVQLLDDLRDWKEDLAARIFTYPLQWAFEHARIDDAQAVGNVLFNGSVASEVVELAISYLNGARAPLSMRCQAPALEAISDARASLRNVQDFLQKPGRVTDPDAVLKEVEEILHPALMYTK